MNKGKLNKNDLLKLTKFDTDELIQYLNIIMDLEIKKSDKMDTDLIVECTNWILELKGLKIKFSNERVLLSVRENKKRFNKYKKRKLIKIIR